jgi:hypothetical protein
VRIDHLVPQTQPHVTGQRLWSAYDLATAFGHSVDWARQELARWRQDGRVTPVSRDSITGARLYHPDQVRAAWQTDNAEPVGGPGPAAGGPGGGPGTAAGVGPDA